MRKPKPMPITIVCTLCGEPWELHPEDPTALDCIAILRAKPTTTVCTHTHYCWHQQNWPWWGGGTWTTPAITTPYFGSLTYSGSNNSEPTYVD